jgi:DNA repair protein RecO
VVKSDMGKYLRDEGIVLTKKNLLKDDKLIIIFSNNSGKIVLLGKGVRKITSRRLSHLETGNLIKFSFYRKGDYVYLRETEIIYGYSKIKQSATKTRFLYLLLFVLNKILPEDQKESTIFLKSLALLKLLNNKRDFQLDDLKNYLREILIIGGFISQNEAIKKEFDPIVFIESLINQKIKIPLI